MRTRFLAAFAVALGATLATPPAPAQDAPGGVHVRVLSIASSGVQEKAADGPALKEKTFVGEELQAPWVQTELKKLPDARFEYKGESVRSRIQAAVLHGKPHTFERLPADHAAAVTLKEPASDTFALHIAVTRADGSGGREKVVDVDLKVLDGGHCVVRCVQALQRAAEGKAGVDLLLLITARTTPF